MNLLAIALAAAVVAPSAQAPSSQASAPAPNVTRTATPTPEEAAQAGTHVKCQEGGELVAHFATQGAKLVAIVDAGEGAHALPIRPWTGGPAILTWSDGQRTLTWSPGVQIMWMDGDAHRMCGGGHHHEH
jgi:hypothetical protein